MDTRFQMHKKALNSLAYNAGKTLERTIAEISPGIVDECLVVDDASRDDTVALARRLLPWHRRSSYEPDAPARGMPQSPRWRVGLVCARMRNFLAGVIGIPCIVHSQNRGYGGQPEDLLHRRVAPGCRHRRHAPSRLPVQPPADRVDGLAGRFGRVRHRPGLADPGQRVLSRGGCRSTSTWRTGS